MAWMVFSGTSKTIQVHFRVGLVPAVPLGTHIVTSRVYQRNFHPLATSATWLYSLIPNRACGFALNKGSTAALGNG